MWSINTVKKKKKKHIIEMETDSTRVTRVTNLINGITCIVYVYALENETGSNIRAISEPVASASNRTRDESAFTAAAGAIGFLRIKI